VSDSAASRSSDTVSTTSSSREVMHRGLGPRRSGVWPMEAKSRDERAFREKAQPHNPTTVATKSRNFSTMVNQSCAQRELLLSHFSASTHIQCRQSQSCPIGITYPTPWRAGNGPVVSTLTILRSRRLPQRGCNVSGALVKWLNMFMINVTSVRTEASCKTRPLHSHFASSSRLPCISFA
jgi:hypothetical protein